MSRFILVNSCDDDPLLRSVAPPRISPFALSSNISLNEPLLDSQQQSEIEAKRFILLYLQIVIYVVGVIGNGLSLLVLMQKRMARISTYIYLAVLSVLDTAVLTTGMLQSWLEELGFVSLRTHSNASCKLTTLSNFVVSDSSVWLIIAVTVERFIAVCYPLKAASMCRRNIATKTILFIICVFCILNLHFLWTVELVEHEKHLRLKLSHERIEVCPREASPCMAAKEHRELINKIWPYLDACIYSFAPFFIIVILNAFIVRKIRQARRRRGGMGGHAGLQQQQQHETLAMKSTREGSRASRSDFASLETQKNISESAVVVPKVPKAARHESSVRLSCMLICISLSFLCMTMPLNVLLIFNNLSSSSDSLLRSKQSLALSITRLLMYLNHSSNFFLYCATGKKFNEELKSIFRHCFRTLRCSRSNSSGSSGRVVVRKTRNSQPVIDTTFNSQVAVVSTSFH